MLNDEDTPWLRQDQPRVIRQEEIHCCALMIQISQVCDIVLESLYEIQEFVASV